VTATAIARSNGPAKNIEGLSVGHVMIDDVPPDDFYAGALVGRREELDAALALVAEDRTVHAALVSGDAGVGKTRVLLEFVQRARQHGALVLPGHCLHFGGDAVPYLPISEAFGRLARDEPAVIEQLRSHFPPIERLLPQRRLIGAGGETIPLDTSDLFEAIFGALVTLAEDRCVVLVIEDAHWADGATRDLIGFLLARLVNERVSLVVTYRTDDLHRRHPLRPVALEWGRLPGVRKIPLGPLADDAMRDLVQQRSPNPLSDPAVRGIVDRAGGNAFFAEQLLAEYDGSDRLPSDLAELLLMRLDRLSMEARDVVQAAAVWGRAVTHALIAAISPIGDAGLDAALREAVDAHVLDRSGPEQFVFRHALLAEAVYDDLLPGERVRLHRAFATALSERTVRGTDADLARHAREAMDLEAAFGATVRAGEEAMRVAAPSEAMRHYEDAIRFSARVRDPALSPAELALRAAEAASAAGHQHRALQLVRQAIDGLPAEADPTTRVELLLAFASYALPLDTAEDFFGASSEALRLVPDEPSPLRARALAVHAHAAAAVYRDDDAARLASEARELADQLNLPVVASEAATTLGKLRERSEHPDDAAHLIQFSIEQAAQAGNLGAALRSQYHLGILHYDNGNLPLAADQFATAMRTAIDGGRPWTVYGFDARLVLSQVKYVMGEWDEALALCSADGQTPTPLAEAGLRATSLAVLSGRGTLTSTLLIDGLRPWWRRDAMIAVLVGTAYLDAFTSRDELEPALALHDEVVELVGDIWENTWFQARIRLHALALAALARAAVTASGRERADLVERGRGLVDAVERTVAEGLRRRPVQGPEGRAWCARVHAEWARLRWLAGIEPPTADELTGSWQSALEAFSYGHVFETARCQLRLAAAWQAVGDSDRAQPLADAARETARRLGAAPLLDEIRLLSGRSTPPGGPGRGPARDAGTDSVSLTPREQQVIALIAEGRSNRQIARVLYISDKTVSVHVSNILAKLGASGRTEAAAIARRDGLLTS
jgi:DNA-binding CsgD family transcriptional regulator/tetratricopeptide (TPR) repeat protein